MLIASENAETIQILRYEHGQKYEPHYDFFVDKKNQKQGGHRLATILMYLSNVKLGGETVFPNAQVPMKFSFFFQNIYIHVQTINLMMQEALISFLNYC